MKRPVFALAAGVALVFAAGCTSDGERPVGGKVSTPTGSRPSYGPPLGASDALPVVDSPPYWCDWVPQVAFRRVTGLTDGLREVRSGQGSTSPICLVRDEQKYGPLGISWSYENGRFFINLKKDDMWHYGYRRLPKMLGYGYYIKYPEGYERPYFVIVMFRCGEKTPNISIDLRQVVAGRDAFKDMVGLVRIAEKRFGRLHGCVPKAL